MKKSIVKVVAVVFILSMMMGSMAGCGSSNAADQVFMNGQVYTQDADGTVASAVAVKEGQIVFVGEDDAAELEALIGNDTEVVDLNGNMMIPGMFDSHSHPISVALDSWSVNMPWTYDVDEMLTFVKEYCEEHPVEEVPYFMGKYYPSDLFGAEGPQAKVLDEYVSDRPVCLVDFSDHCFWFNSKAMELMGIDKNTPEAEGTAEIVRDAEGNPTGWFKEDEAFLPYIDKMYEAIGWAPPTSADEDMWKTVIDFYHSVGVIGMGSVAAVDATADEDAVKAIYALDQAGELDMYYSHMVRLFGYDDLDRCINTIRDYQEKYSTDNITFDTVKYFVDGTNEIGTSYMVEPFSNDPSGKDCGKLDMNQEQLTETMVRLNEENLDLQMHVVGDGGFRVICDATEEAMKQCGENWNMQIEVCHCEIIHEDDETRPAELGIIVNWTPHWTGGYFGEAAMEWLGEERFNDMYDFQPMIKAGAVVDFGSDTVSNYEFHRSSPFFGMETAITRVDPEFPMDAEKYPGSVRPEDEAKFTMDQMIKGYTLNGAIQFRIDDQTGSIEVGKNADLVVIEKNLYDVDPFELKEITPKAVIFNGETIVGEF